MEARIQSFQAILDFRFLTFARMVFAGTTVLRVFTNCQNIAPSTNLVSSAQQSWALFNQPLQILLTFSPDPVCFYQNGRTFSLTSNPIEGPMVRNKSKPCSEAGTGFFSLW